MLFEQSLVFCLSLYFQRGCPEIYIGGRTYRKYQPLNSKEGTSNATLSDVVLFAEVCEGVSNLSIHILMVKITRLQ